MNTIQKPGTSINKLAFFNDIGYEPHPGQLKVHLSQAPRRLLACGVRWGKSLAAAAEALAAAMEPNERSIGWCVAPTYDLADKIFREIVVLVSRHLRHRIITLKENEKRLVLRNMAGGISEIRGKSADNPTSLLGEGLSFCILDECARCKGSVWTNHLTQRLIDHKGWALLVSTPRGKGWYYDLFRRGQSNDPDFESWNSPSWENPHLDSDLIEAERDRLPERVFQQEFGGKFLEGAGQVFRNVRDCATGEFAEPKPDQTYYAGLDLAKVEDFTVLVICDAQCHGVFIDRFHRLDWSIQVARIEAATTRYNKCRVQVDSTGAGEPVYENLRKAGVRAQGYPFTQKSKSALIDNLAILFEKQKVIIPRPDLWPEGVDELESFEYSISDSGNVKSGCPSGMHDDCVIALALACWIPGRRKPGGKNFGTAWVESWHEHERLQSEKLRRRHPFASRRGRRSTRPRRPWRP